MSYSNSFPTQRPSLNLVFNGGSDQLDSRISFSRSDTPPTYAAPSAVHYWSNEKHLSSENLLLQSQDFDTTWTASSIAAPTGSQTAPDGTSTAWLFSLASGAVVRAGIYQDWTPTANTEYTLVTHLKAGTASHGYVSIRTNSGDYYAGALLDFSAGTISVTSAGMTSATGTVTALGSSWYKVTVTATSGTNLSSPQITIGISDGSAVGTNGRPATWTAAGTETMYAWGAQLSSTNSKAYDSPTTTQISRSYSSTLKSVANAGDPRFEYDASGNAKGLLIESQATNLQRYGSDFANWAINPNTSITSEASVAPNGLLEADLVVASSTPAFTYVYDSLASIVNGTTYTASVYIKSSGQRYVQFAGGTSSFHVDRYATFDLQTGSVDANAVTASAQDVGNGWWRIQMSILATATSSSGIFIAFVDSATASRLPTFTGNDYDGLLLWGFQLETGSSASSLVDTGTSSSSATRAADSCSVALSDVGITSGQDLTAVVEGDAAEIAGAALIGFDDGSSSNYARILRHHSNNNYTFDVRTNASSQAVITLNSSSTANEFAFRLEQNNIGASAGGSAVTTDTSATLGLMTTMQIGNAYWGTQANGTISRVSIYSEPLSDTNLTALTS